MERVFWRVPEQHERDISRLRSDRRSLFMMREMSHVEVNGIGLAYVIAGDTGLPPVVLLHALGEDSIAWTTVIEALAPRCRVYAVDLRGHGGSSHPGDYSLELMRADVLGFLRTLHLEEVTLIGHSLGAAVAYLVAEAEPGLVRQLILEEPPPPLPATPPRVVPSEPSEPLPFDWRVLDAIARQRNHPDPAWWENLNLITARTLVVAGGTDSHLPQDQIATLAGRIPDATMVIIHAGHNVHSIRPDAFLAALLPFLAGQVPAPSAT
jgi:3-oxoadipate enol-lactonase